MHSRGASPPWTVMTGTIRPRRRNGKVKGGKTPTLDSVKADPYDLLRAVRGEDLESRGSASPQWSGADLSYRPSSFGPAMSRPVRQNHPVLPTTLTGRKSRSC